MKEIMIYLKQRNFACRCVMPFFIMVIVVGMTACSGKAGNAIDSVGSRTEIVENGQHHTKAALEEEPTNTPALSVSKFETEEEQVISEKCGKSAVWTYDTGSKLLWITGTGVVNQRIKKSKEYVSPYGLELEYPVKEIRIEEGITALDCCSLFQNIMKEEEAEEIKISLPDSLERIGANTFEMYNDTQYIRRIHLPCKLRYIEGGAFWGIGHEAYPHAYSYQEDVKRIAKTYKRKLKITVDKRNPYYIVKNGVLFTKDVKTLVYYPSEKVDKVYRIPKSVTKIKALAFSRNSFLQEIILPHNIQVIGAGAFFNDHRLVKINLEQAKKLKRICDVNGQNDKIDVETGVPEGYEVPEDDERYDNPAENRRDWYSLGTFAGTKLKGIQFPDRLKYVAYNTFKNCFCLKKISIGASYAGEINPDHVGDIKGFLLPDRPAMEIRVSERNRHYKVRNHILYSKDGKTLYKALKAYRDSTLVLDRRVQKIARQAFSGAVARKLRKVVVLGNLKQISREAFAVSHIESFEAHGNVDEIGIDAFFRCYDLEKFVCHGRVKRVGAQAFYYAVHVRKISLGKDTPSIGTWAFEGCGKKPHIKKKGA